MKEEHIVWGSAILIQLIMLLKFYYHKRQSRKTDAEVADYKYERYIALREATLSLKPGDLGIALPADKETAFAMMMEIHTVEVLQSVVSFANGQVWTFNTSNGRKNILDDHNDIKTAAIGAVKVSQYHFARMRRRNTDGLIPGHVKFHILTDLDVYSCSGPLPAMLNERSEWEELVSRAFEVVDEIFKTGKDRQIKRVYTKIAVNRIKPANL